MGESENLMEELTIEIENIVQDSLELGFDDFVEMLKTMPVVGVHHLSKILMQEREKNRIILTNNESLIEELRMELKEKEEVIGIRENDLILLREEILELKQIIDELEKQMEENNETMKHESEEMLMKFKNIHKEQEESNLELEESLQEIKEQNNELRRIQINNQKLLQEIELLKRTNELSKKWLHNNTIDIDQKTLLWKEKEKELKMENELLKEKVFSVEKKNEQLEYFVYNEIIKAKLTTSEEPNHTEEESNNKEPNIQPTNKNNDNCFQGLELEYYNKFVGEYKHSDKKSEDNSSFLLSLEEIQQEEKDKNNSIDKSDSLSLKGTIISSSKAFIDENLFEHQSCESKSFNGKMFGGIEITDKNNQYVQPFLAKEEMEQKPIQKNSPKERLKLNTALNKEKFFKIIEENKSEKSALSDRSVKTDFIEQRNASTERESTNRNKIETPQERIRKNLTEYNCLLDTKSPLMEIISKDKEIEQLKSKQENYEKNLLEIEKSLELLEKEKTKQIIELKEQIFEELANINKLNKVLEESSLKNVYYQEKIQELNAFIYQYQKQIELLSIDNHQLKASLQNIQLQHEEYNNNNHNNNTNNNTNNSTNNLYNDNNSGEVANVDMEKYLKLAENISLKESVYSEVQSEKNMLDDSEEYPSSATKTVEFNNLNEPLFHDQNQNTPSFNAIETQTTHQLSFCSLVKNTVSFLYSSPSNHTSSETSEENLLESFTKESSEIKKFAVLENEELIVNKKDLSNIEEEKIEEVEASENDDTIYYSFEEILTKDKENEEKGNLITEISNSAKAKKEMKKSLQLDPLKQIAKLQALASIAWSKLGIFNFKGLVPDISTIVIAKAKILPSNIISRNRNSNKKEFYLLNCLLESNEKFLPDKLLLWREGIASLRLDQCLLMAGIKKFIYDSECWSYGNSEIIVENSHITIKRMTKRNYLYGNLGGNKWKLIEVEIYGTY